MSGNFIDFIGIWVVRWEKIEFIRFSVLVSPFENKGRRGGIEMVEIRELSIGLVHGPGLDGQLGSLEQRFCRRISEIVDILVSFSEPKQSIFPDVLWKVTCAIEDTLRAAMEAGSQPREQALAFLGFVAAVFNAIEVEPIPVNWGFAGFSLNRGVEVFDDGRSEACFGAIRVTVGCLQDLKEELRAAKESARISFLRAQAARV